MRLFGSDSARNAGSRTVSRRLLSSQLPVCGVRRIHAPAMRLLTVFTFLAVAFLSHAKTPGDEAVTILTDVAYKSGDGLSAYEKERCKLDVYLPKGAKDFPTLVWFHGGGLTNGSKGRQEGDEKEGAK